MKEWNPIGTLDRSVFQFVIIGDAVNEVVRLAAWEPSLGKWCQIWPPLTPLNDPNFNEATHWMKVPEAPQVI